MGSPGGCGVQTAKSSDKNCWVLTSSFCCTALMSWRSRSEKIATRRLVVGRTIACPRVWSPFPRAFIGVLCAAGVIPSVEVGIADRLLRLVRHDRSHAVGAAVVVGAGGLRFTCRRTAIRVSDERILN